MDEMVRTVFLLTVAFLHTVSSQTDCPSGWSVYNNKCWFFSNLQPELSWTAAESWCQQNGGNLASFETVAERNWVVDQNIKGMSLTRWWIGLNDIQTEELFVWSDGTVYNEIVSNWKPLEPNNAYLENCVEIWIDNDPPIVNDKQWNDRSCDGMNGYICKRVPGSVTICPSNYQENNGRCYFVSSGSEQWIDAQQECKMQGANLVSVTSDSERQFVESLVYSEYTSMWVGLSDTSTPGTLTWSDPNSVLSYNNWASGQPASPLPYYGSTCTEMNQGLNYQWNTAKCSEERRFVCERGRKADCPPTWLYSSASGKCYEFVINPSRLLTWSSAKLVCQGYGGGMLKIQSKDEETFVGSVLEAYSGGGHPLVWLGASDVGHDESFTWWDQTPIQEYYWGPSMPQTTAGREDCLALYTGKSSNNWETATCFEMRAYICELPEGQGLPTAPVVTVDGKCQSGWRHFNGKCYFFGSEERTRDDAESYCVAQSAHLTSILTDNELSFIVGNLQRESWIGLQGTDPNWSWIDNEAPTATYNWMTGEPDGDGQCVTVNQIGEWADKPCTTRTPFVCKKDDIPVDHVTIPPPTYVPDEEKCGGDGWISDPSSDRCYRVNIQLRSWSDARFACQTGGGDLAAISSPAENAHVHALTSGIPTLSIFWLAGNDLNNYNVELVDQGWSWADGSPFNYINWSDGEPNNINTEDCMEMYHDGKWNDNDCYVYLPSVCEKVGNMDNIVGVDITDDNCKSNEACCFKHMGIEYGGPLPDSAITASTERDQWFTADRGRLNTPADVIITDVEGQVSYGNGHGAWSPNLGEAEPWLQVDFPYHSELKGIITQGRNGIIQYSERQWVTSYKVSYSQDAAAGKWEFVSDSNNQPVIFDGNSDQNTQVTNLFPRPVIARHVRCHPVTWFDAPCMRLEYIGCKANCLHKLGMNSGLIPNNMITASSGDATQARAPVDTGECLPNAGDNGANYRGWIARTTNGLTCQAWASQDPHKHDLTPQNYPNADLRSNHCRNPNGRSGPWCYTTDTSVEWEYCDVPVCPGYVPSGWTPSVSNTGQYVQVQFTDFFKVSGVTMYNGNGGSNVVTSYTLSFGNDGINFITYQDQGGSDHMFTGLNTGQSEYTDILREPISAKFVRISPQNWNGGIRMQFELNGCYVDGLLTCSDTASLWDDQSSFAAECPAGCVEDFEQAPVYGTDIYTKHSSVCRAAVHAGKVLNVHGGSISVDQTEGLVAYQGQFQNGITSQSFGPYGASFKFSGNTLRCDDGWYAWQDHCYYLSPKGVVQTWHDARSACINLGGDLVSIWTEGENKFIESTIYTADLGGDVWIGLNDLDVVNFYQWSDGTPVTITKWFWDEPKQSNKHCVNIYRFEAYWNDKSCDETLPYMCKKNKQLLPPLDGPPPAEEGCDAGWKAYGASCYLASTDEYMFIYANRICEEKGGKLASVHDDFEQSFIYSMVLNTLPPGLGYTSWIGLSAKVTESGSLYYEWETEEIVTYTHWDKGEPEVRFSCAFPFVYKDITFYECTTFDHPARLEDTPWCSIDPVYRGRWINCGIGYEYGCTFMDDTTGFWQIDICGQNRYYVCEKDRVGYTQPVETTPSTVGNCATGWFGNSNTAACYQINEKVDRADRVSWQDALTHCRSQGADLVSVHSYQEEQEIANLIYDVGLYTYTSFWMGLNTIDLDEGYQWTDGTPVSYTNWNYGEPNDHNGNEPCVESQFINYAMWNDLNCDAVRNWICKIPKGTDPQPPPTIPPPGGQPSTECGTDGDWIRFIPSYGLDKCYLFVDQPLKGWALSEQDCTARGGHLVAVHSADENTFLLSRVAKLNADTAWIGLLTVDTADGRALRWSDNSSLDFTNWAAGEPNNYYNQEDCVEMDGAGGLWNDDNCGVQMGYVCEKYIGADSVPIVPTQPAQGGCEDGFLAYGNKCWMFGGYGDDPELDWFTSLERCNNNSAVLASVLNSYEQSFITSKLPEIGSNLWIGLSGRISGNYVWQDQSPVTYTNWASGRPDGSGDTACVQVISSSSNAGKWDDNNCYNLKPFVCHKTRSPALPEPTAPSGDQCKSGYQLWVDGCYKIVSQAANRDDAKSMCQADGTNLVTITNTYENNLIKSWFLRDITTADKIWTGMTFIQTVTDIDNTVTTFTWDDGWPVDFTNWAATEPNTEVMASGSGCVIMKSDGTWMTSTSTSCSTSSFPFVCKQALGQIPTTPDPGEGNCDPGFVAYGTSCYYVETAQYTSDYRSWHDATYECASRGATLASFHSEEECLAVINSIEGGSHNMYIGLTSNGYSGWKWADGSAVEFTYWTPGEPNGMDRGEDCVEMYPWDGKWNDVDCFQGRGYICKKSKEFSACGKVDPVDRQDCGYTDIDESVCLRRGCCWDPLYINVNFTGCFYPFGSGPSGFPVTEPSGGGGGGISAGAVVGIVIGVIALLLLGGGIFYCWRSGGTKDIKMPSMPAMPQTWFTASSAETGTAQKDAGFDNPVVSMNTDNEAEA